MFKRRKPFLLLLLIIFTFGSCIKDELNMGKFTRRIELDPGLAIPVGYGNLTINDLVKRFDTTGSIKEGPDSFLYITYTNDFLSFPASSILSLPDQIYNQFFIQADISGPFLGDSVSTNPKSQDYAFSMGKGEEVDSMVVKSGSIQYTFHSTFRNIARLDINSPNIVKNNHIYRQSFNIGNVTGNFSSTLNYDISGCTIYFKRSNDSSYIPLNFNLTLFQSGNPVRATDSVNVDFVFSQLEYKILYGNVGYKNFVNQQSSIMMDLFKPSIKGNIEFANPTFSINVDNSFGVPVKINLTNVSAFSEKNNITTPISFPQSQNPISIIYPSLDEIGQSRNTQITFDSISPPMTDVINTSPSRLDFNIDGYSDTTVHLTQFLTDTSSLHASLEVNLPMWFRAGDLALEDTMKLDLEHLVGIKNFTPEMIQNVFLRLVVDNGLPLDVKMQVYFTDSTYHVLDSLFTDTNPQIPSGVLNAQYRVVQSTNKVNDVQMDNAKFARINKTKWALINAAITTTQYSQNPTLKVKFYSNYKLHFQLYMKASLKITENNF